MKSTSTMWVVWSLLSKAEQRRSFGLVTILLLGTVLEVISVGALVPLAHALTQSDLKTKYPITSQIFPNSSDQLVVTVILVVVVGVFLIKEMFLGFSLWKLRGFIAGIEIRFQTELFERYISQPYQFHVTNNSSKLVQNILNSTNFSYNVLDPVFFLLSDGLVAISVCVLLIAIEPTAMFITISSVTTVAVVFHNFSKQKLEKWGAERQFKDRIKLQHMSETFGGIKEVLITRRDEYFRRRFLTNIDELAQINRKFRTLLGIPRLYLELLTVVGLAVLVLSMIALGRSAESLVPLLALFVGGAFRLMPAINRITVAFQSLRMAGSIVETLRANTKSIFLMELSDREVGQIQLSRKICLDDITFAYPNTREPIFEGLNLEITKGSQVGLVGTTGAGKSTLVDILLGLLQPNLGRVTIDGVDISLNYRSWQNQIGYVPQSIFLLDSSIRENVAFGISEENIDDEKIAHALDQAQLRQFVEELPGGLNELVGERGVKLSGGQRQRLGIARALYSNPTLLIFDEATSALDVGTEMQIMNSLSQMKTNKTILIVTHRMSALDNCDQIFTIENKLVRAL